MEAKGELLEEHRTIEKVLGVFEKELAEVQRRGAVAAGRLEKIIGFVKTYVEGFHMRREEEHLYPVLANAGMKGVEGPLALMIYKHDMAMGYLRKLEDVLPRAEAGEAEALAELGRSGRALAELVHARIRLEDLVLVPALDLIVKKEAREALADALAREDGAGGGNPTHAGMLAAADEIGRHPVAAG